MSTQRVRVWVAGLTIGGAVNKAQNSTVSAFLYALSGTSDLLVVPSQYFYFLTESNSLQISSDGALVARDTIMMASADTRNAGSSS